MPGMSLIYSPQGDRTPGDPKALKALEPLLFGPDYTSKVLLDDRYCFLAATTYPSDRVATFDSDTFLVALEGNLYGKSASAIERELFEVATDVFDETPAARDRLTSWLLEADGEFLIFIYNKRSRMIAVVPDAKALLPFYHVQDSDSLLASREPAFLAALMTHKRPDRLGLGQLLMFRYCLGTRTLIENVRRLAPASILGVGPGGRKAQVVALYQWDFDQKENAGRSPEENARRLGDSHVEACRRRAEAAEGPQVLALSGGFDSRMVGVGYHAAGASCRAVTFLDADRKALPDVEVAERLARVLGFDWKRMDLPPARGSDALDLLQTRFGIDSLMSMSFIMPFDRALRAEYGPRLTCITGDTGLAWRSHTPERPVRSLDQLFSRCILPLHGAFSAEAVAAMVGVSPGDLLEAARQVVEAYPEKTLAGKYAHFVHFQRGFMSHYEGLDRDRHFFRMSTPLEALGPFRYAVNCPEEQKSHYAMFCRVLARLSPGAYRLPHANYGASPGTLRFRLRMAIQDLYYQIPEWGRNLVRAVVSRKKYAPVHNPQMLACLRRQLTGSEAVGEYVNPGAVERSILTCSPLRLELISTAASVVELLLEGRSTLEDFKDAELF